MFKIKKNWLRFVVTISVPLIIFLFFLPTLIKNYVIKNSPELAGRSIDIGSLHYNYFTSTAKIYDFKMHESDDTNTFIKFDTLILNLEPLQFFKDNLEIESLYLKGLTTNVVMTDSLFNFDDLIAFHNKTDTISTSKTSDLEYNISNIKIKDANFYFENKRVNHTTEVEDITFTVPFIGWHQDKKSKASAKFNFKNGGYFESIINVNPVSGAYDAKFLINTLYLNPFLNYVKEYADINTFEGRVNAEIDITGNINDPIKSIVSGHSEVSDFKMTDTNNKTFLSSKKINCNLAVMDYFNEKYVINSLAISDSYTFFQLDSVSNNFFRIFKLDISEEDEILIMQSDSSTIQNKNNGGIYYAINELKLNNGILDYTDNLTGEPFNYHLSEIEVDSDSISSTSKWLNIYSTMLLNNRGNLKADLGIDPNNYFNTTLDLAVEKFLLPDLNLYTNYYMGHSLLKGDMYYISKSKILDGQIESENKLLVKNASLENTKSGLYNLPLKFAFFLLTDKNGDVKLDIPVSGNLNDPEVNVGKIVWQTFKNVIGKTVAAPVNFLVGLVGGDPKELEEITFGYTDSIPSEKHYRQLNKLLDLEQKKEELKITLTYFVDKALHKEALALNTIGRLFNTNTSKDYLKDEDDFKTYLNKKVNSDSLSIDTAVKELTQSMNTDSLANAASNKMISLVTDYLKMEYPATTITVIKGTDESPENTGAYPMFKITYGLIGENDSVSEVAQDTTQTN